MGELAPRPRWLPHRGPLYGPQGRLRAHAAAGSAVRGAAGEGARRAGERGPTWGLGLGYYRARLMDGWSLLERLSGLKTPH